MLVATLAALAWANSEWLDTYRALWSTELRARIGDLAGNTTIGDAVNDGLLALSFSSSALRSATSSLTGWLLNVQEPDRELHDDGGRHRLGWAARERSCAALVFGCGKPEPQAPRERVEPRAADPGAASLRAPLPT